MGGITKISGLESLINTVIEPRNIVLETMSRPLQSLIESYTKLDQLNPHKIKFGDITNIAKALSQQTNPTKDISRFFKNNHEIYSSLPNITEHAAIKGLTSSLIEIAASNFPLSKKLTNYASSQLNLFHSLSEVVTKINQPHLETFNAITVALQGITESYLKNIAKTKNWDDIDVAEEVNETILSLSEEFINNETCEATQDELYQFRDQYCPK